MRLIKPALVYALGALKSLWEDGWGSWLKAFYYTNFRQNANNVTGLYWAQMHPHTPDLPLHVHHEQGISTVWVRCIPKKYMVALVDTALQSPKGTGVVWRKTLESPGPKSRATVNHQPIDLPRLEIIQRGRSHDVSWRLFQHCSALLYFSYFLPSSI